METTTPNPQRSPNTFSAIPRQNLAAIVVLLAGIAMAFVMARTEGDLASLWLLGILAGFVLQRSRFCFASAFRDVFLFGNSQIMKGILAGLAVSTIGFSIIMYHHVPFPIFGGLPPEAHILPVGFSTIIGGILFGFGMVLSGGCVSGSLYRTAEGYVGSWISVIGILVGLGLLSQNWNWWWSHLIYREPRIWLPSTFGMGYAGGITLTLVTIVAALLLLLWWEARNGLSSSQQTSISEPPVTFRGKLSILWYFVFVKGWPAAIGGASLGVIGILMYMVHMPWGVTGELARLADLTMSTVGLPPPEALGLNDIGGCAAKADGSGIFTHSFSVTVGLLVGALVGALFAKEFKLRFPRKRRRYLQSLTGGIFMGYGSGLAIGCTVGAFFSSVASLSVSGWLFALALAGGALLGVQTIKRIQ